MVVVQTSRFGQRGPWDSVQVSPVGECRSLSKTPTTLDLWRAGKGLSPPDPCKRRTYICTYLGPTPL